MPKKKERVKSKVLWHNYSDHLKPCRKTTKKERQGGYNLNPKEANEASKDDRK